MAISSSNRLMQILVSCILATGWSYSDVSDSASSSDGSLESDLEDRCLGIYIVLSKVLFLDIRCIVSVSASSNEIFTQFWLSVRNYSGGILYELLMVAFPPFLVLNRAESNPEKSIVTLLFPIMVEVPPFLFGKLVISFTKLLLL
jgi:hypothetical protein